MRSGIFKDDKFKMYTKSKVISAFLGLVLTLLGTVYFIRSTCTYVCSKYYISIIICHMLNGSHPQILITQELKQLVIGYSNTWAYSCIYSMSMHGVYGFFNGNLKRCFNSSDFTLTCQVPCHMHFDHIL